MTGSRRLLVPGQFLGSVYDFYHFLLGYLYPLTLWLDDADDVVGVVRECGPMDPWRELVLARHRLEVVDAGEMLRRLARREDDPVVLPSWDHPDTFRRHDLLRFRELVLTAAHVEEPSSRVRRVLFSDRAFSDPFYRGGSAEFRGGADVGVVRRRVPNALAIHERLLEEAGAEMVDLATLSPMQQVDRLASTDVLVGQHGAGLLNMIWMPPGSAVVELLPPTGPLFSRMFGRLAGVLGHIYTTVLQDHPHAPVDPEAVARAVERVRRPGARTSPARVHPVARRADRIERLRRGRTWLAATPRRSARAVAGSMLGLIGRDPRRPTPPRVVAVPGHHAGALEERGPFLLGHLEPLLLDLESAESSAVTLRSCGELDAWFRVLPERHRWKTIPPGAMVFLAIRRPERVLVLPADDDPERFDADRLDRFRRTVLERVRAAGGLDGPRVVVLIPSDEPMSDRRADDQRSSVERTDGDRVSASEVRASAEALSAAVRERCGFDAHDVVVVSATPRGPDETVATFSNARVLVALAGVDPVDMVWMPTGSTVISVDVARAGRSPEQRLRDVALARVLDHDHRAGTLDGESERDTLVRSIVTAAS